MEAAHLNPPDRIARRDVDTRRIEIRIAGQRLHQLYFHRRGRHSPGPTEQCRAGEARRQETSGGAATDRLRLYPNRSPVQWSHLHDGVYCISALTAAGLINH